MSRISLSRYLIEQQRANQAISADLRIFRISSLFSYLVACRSESGGVLK